MCHNKKEFCTRFLNYKWAFTLDVTITQRWERISYAISNLQIWEHITLFRSITLFCGTNNIQQNISYFSPIKHEYGKYQGIYYGILSISPKNVMDLNNIMQDNGTNIF